MEEVAKHAETSDTPLILHPNSLLLRSKKKQPVAAATVEEEDADLELEIEGEGEEEETRSQPDEKVASNVVDDMEELSQVEEVVKLVCHLFILSPSLEDG